MKIKKLLPCIFALAAMPAFASGTDAVAKKVGPVSYYGALHTSGSKVIGAKNNQQVILRGMSYFWSDATGLPYYTKTVLNWAVDNLKIDVIRFAMGVTYYGTGTDNKMSDGYSYASAPDSYLTIIDQMVEAAVENDIYIIIDWHSHRANSETDIANTFFKTVAAKYANVPNVIFEIFNEPVCSWSEISSYANTVIPGIRASTENLIVVGTPSYSAQPNSASGLNYTNLAYALHFYAASHSVSSYGSNASSAMSAGKPVFVTEYGTVNYDGAGTPSESSSTEWFNFMDQNMISSCNWSLRQTITTNSDGSTKDETSAMFSGSTELTTKAALDGATYSASGKIVKNYLTSKARTWADTLVKGKNTGSCAFSALTASELDGSVASKLKSGCTYVSSNENVVTSSGEIKGSGYVVMTGSDNSESVITITEIPNQSVPNFMDLTCTYSRTCTTNRTLPYSGGTNNEWIVTTNAVTLEGTPFTLTSLNPDVVTVKIATCTSTSCSSAQKNQQVVMYEFKSFGSAKIVASAAAVSGYKAVQDTVTVTYEKGTNKITNNFKDTQLAFGASADKLLPDTTMYSSPVTYTYNDSASSPYVTKSGNALIAGNQNAIVKITANVPETDLYKEFHKTITVIVGDSSQAVNKQEAENVGIFQTRMDLPLHATIANAQLYVGSDNAGDVKVELFSATGRKVMSKTMSKLSTISLASLPNGFYRIVISQGVRQLSINWNKSGK